MPLRLTRAIWFGRSVFLICFDLFFRGRAGRRICWFWLDWSVGRRLLVPQPVTAARNLENLMHGAGTDRGLRWHWARLRSACPVLLNGRLLVIIVERVSYRRMMISKNISPLLRGKFFIPISSTISRSGLRYLASTSLGRRVLHHAGSRGPSKMNGRARRSPA